MSEIIPFTHLHCHTQFSLLDGAASIKGIMKKAQKNGMKAVAITDHGNMFGAFKFVAEANAHNLKPIVGCEFYLVKDRHLKTFKKGEKDKRYHQLLLAKNAEGYHNISKLCSLGFIEGYYSKFPRIDKELLVKYHKGVIATSCCLGAEIPQAIMYEGEQKAEELLKWWVDLFGEDYYIELQRHHLENVNGKGMSQEDINQVLLGFAKKYNLKVIATNDSHYVEEEDSNAHDILLCINTGAKFNEPKSSDEESGKGRFAFPNSEFYFKTQEEMNKLFADIPQAIDYTNEIFDKVEPLKLKRDVLMPNFPLPQGFATQFDFLKHLTFEGARQKYGTITAEIEQRLNYELEIMQKMGFEGYFLIVQDFINAARKLDVAVGLGRGCLEGNTLILTKNGLPKKIKDIQIGEEVFTQDGSLQKVCNTFEYDTKNNENLLFFRVYYGDLQGVTLTKDHKILAEKQTYSKNYENWAESTKKSRKKPDVTGNLSWYKAEDLQVGDWVFVPKPQVKVEDIEIFDLAVFSNNKNLYHDEEFVYHDVLNPLCNTIQKTKKVSRYLKIDEDFFKILGIFVGDGWMRKNERPCVSFAFGAKESEKEHQDFVVNYFTSKGFEVSIAKEYRGSVQVHINNKHLYLLFRRLFKDYEFTATTKHLPTWVTHAPENKIFSFLEGYLLSDGHDDGAKYRFVTVSEKLAYQIRFIAWRVGIPASLGIDVRKKAETREAFKNRKEVFVINMPRNERIGKTSAKVHYAYKSLENGIMLKIREIKEVEHIQKVYDIEVENNHNYLSTSFLVHNSAAGSAVAYCIGITNIDPIQYNLLFERFLNPERVSMPDIDTDFDDEGRQKVIDYVVDKYGKNQVASIITYGTMAAKMAIKDVGRVLELPLQETNELAKLISDKPGTKLKDEYEKPEIKEILAEGSLRSTVLKEALVLEGSIRNRGVHAAGIIIAPDDITNYIPVCTDSDSDLLITQFDGKVIEDAGMLKMDFLGLKTLTIIKDAIKLIKKNKGIEIDIDKIPLDDPKTFELYQKGETVGTFQFESEGMQMYLRQLKPTNIEDLIAMNALYRPGPMDFIPLFIDRKQGREPVEYPHPLLEPILKNTYGIMVYQEQIMQTAQIIAGYTLGGADLLRRAMGKKDKEKMAKEREKFVKGAKEIHNIDEKKSNEIFDIMERFAEYGFNRSHSAAYSVVAYQTAYLKANFPSEYMASVLTHSMGNIEKITFFLEECKRQGLEVLGPDINESYATFDVNKQGKIRFGLGAIKGAGEVAVANIIEERDKNGEYKSIFDFAERVTLQSVNKKTFEALAQAGSLDCFKEVSREAYFTQEDGTTFIEKIIRYGNAIQNERNSAQQSLFGGGANNLIPPPKLPKSVEAWSEIERLNKEKEVVGFYISGHPLDQYRLEMNHLVTCKLSELSDPKWREKEIFVGGIVAEVQTKQAKNGSYFTLFRLEDYESSTQLALFGSDHAKFSGFAQVNNFLFIKGKMQKRWGNEDQYELKVQNIELLSEVRERAIKNIHLQVDLQFLSERLVAELETLLQAYKGATPLRMTLFDSKENIQVQAFSKKYAVNVENTLLEVLERIEGVKCSIIT
jgi:DNA polymerase-3 subunit alpha